MAPSKKPKSIKSLMGGPGATNLFASKPVTPGGAPAPRPPPAAKPAPKPKAKAPAPKATSAPKPSAPRARSTTMATPAPPPQAMTSRVSKEKPKWKYGHPSRAKAMKEEKEANRAPRKSRAAAAKKKEVPKAKATGDPGALELFDVGQGGYGRAVARIGDDVQVPKARDPVQKETGNERIRGGDPEPYRPRSPVLGERGNKGVAKRGDNPQPSKARDPVQGERGNKEAAKRGDLQSSKAKRGEPKRGLNEKGAAGEETAKTVDSHDTPKLISTKKGAPLKRKFADESKADNAKVVKKSKLSPVTSQESHETSQLTSAKKAAPVKRKYADLGDESEVVTEKISKKTKLSPVASREDETWALPEADQEDAIDALFAEELGLDAADQEDGDAIEAMLNEELGLDAADQEDEVDGDAAPGDYAPWPESESDESEEDPDSDSEDREVRAPTPPLVESDGWGFKNPKKEFDFYLEAEWPAMVEEYGPPGHQVSKERMEARIRKNWAYVGGAEQRRYRGLAEESAKECVIHNAAVWNERTGG